MSRSHARDAARAWTPAARALLTASIATACGLASFWFQRLSTSKPSDFAQLWYAAGAWRHGANPYAVVGPGRPFEWPFPLLYPLPAVVVAVPFSFLPLHVAEALFVATGTGALALALTSDARHTHALWLFLSLIVVDLVQTVQWSPLLTAAAFTPSLGFLFAAKPTVGAALLLARPSRRAVLGAAAFGLATIAFWPWWVGAWLQALPAATHISAPVMRLGGPLIFAALLRWRRPEAWLLVALACAPVTPELYELVPLFLIVSSLEEGLILIALILVTHLLRRALMPAAGTDLIWWTTSGALIVALVYLPCVLMILRRPNVGQPPWAALVRWRRAPDDAGEAVRESAL